MAADRLLLCGLVTGELLRLVAALAELEGRPAEPDEGLCVSSATCIV